MFHGSSFFKRALMQTVLHWSVSSPVYGNSQVYVRINGCYLKIFHPNKLVWLVTPKKGCKPVLRLIKGSPFLGRHQIGKAKKSFIFGFHNSSSLSPPVGQRSCGSREIQVGWGGLDPSWGDYGSQFVYPSRYN